MSLCAHPAGYLGSNAIMGGMLLHQTRNVGQRYTCTGRFQRFIVACTVSGTVYSNGTALSATDTAAVLSGDTQSLDSGAALPPFGVDPVFLTGSAFYDPGLLGQIGEPLRCMLVATASTLSSLLGRLARPPVSADMHHLLSLVTSHLLKLLGRLAHPLMLADMHLLLLVCGLNPLQEAAVLLVAAVLGLRSLLLPITVLQLCTALVLCTWASGGGSGCVQAASEVQLSRLPMVLQAASTTPLQTSASMACPLHSIHATSPTSQQAGQSSSSTASLRQPAQSCCSTSRWPTSWTRAAQL